MSYLTTTGGEICVYCRRPVKSGLTVVTGWTEHSSRVQSRGNFLWGSTETTLRSSKEVSEAMTKCTGCGRMTPVKNYEMVDISQNKRRGI